jgi:hypothetical protein
MNKLTGLITLTSASALTLGLSSGLAQATHKGPPHGQGGSNNNGECFGSFETPMMTEEGVIETSKAETCDDGRWEVKIPSVSPGEYAVCFHFQEFFSQPPIGEFHIYLADEKNGGENGIVPHTGGDFKAEGTLTNGLAGSFFGFFGENPYVDIDEGVVGGGEPASNFSSSEHFYQPGFKVFRISGHEHAEAICEEGPGVDLVFRSGVQLQPSD